MADEDKPPERPTAKLDQTEILKGLVKNLTDSMATGFAKMEAKIDEGFSDFQKRITRVEAWKDEVDARMNRSSERVRGQSEVDLAHEAKIAAEIMAREALAQKVDAIDKNLTEVKTETAKQTAILGDLKTAALSFAKHPLTQLIVVALSILLTGWISAHGGKLP
jgi:hypothetical protein